MHKLTGKQIRAGGARATPTRTPPPADATRCTGATVAGQRCRRCAAVARLCLQHYGKRLRAARFSGWN